MQVQNFLENSAQKTPDKQAVWYKDEWMTFGELDLLSNKLANYLKEQHVHRGDRVAILYENSFHYIIAYYAVLKVGAVTVALNTATTADALEYLLNDSGAVAIITNASFSKDLVPALKKVPNLRHVVIQQDDLSEYQAIGHCSQISYSEVLDSGNEQTPDVRGIDLDLASIVYTSGSTGKPKGVTLTHLNIVSNTRSIVSYLEITEKDRVMVVLPFYYIYGKSLLNTHFYAGGSVVIDNAFAYPNVVLKNMEKTGVTGFSGVPSTFIILLNRSSIRDYEFPTLRYITQAGGAMAPSVQKDVSQVFSNARVFIMYGATEASARLSYLEPEMLPKKFGSIGKAIPNVDLFIADDNGVELPQGKEGEIVAKGSNLMVGYWNDPIETEKVLRNGVYYTGDIGVMDEDGYLFVVGRKKDMIKVGGERVSAKEVEEKLLEIDAVHETAVIGVKDEIMGEAIKAFIVPLSSSDTDEKAIIDYLRQKLPAYKLPKVIEFVKELPKNESGKILKTKLS